MKKILFSCFIFLISLFGALSSYAYHTAGSEMKYKCLGKDSKGNDKYEITLIFWRDCSANGPNVAKMDPEINVFFFTASPKMAYWNPESKLVKLTKHILKLDNLSSALACVVQPPNICLELGEYTFEQSFPPRKGGYYVGWQRCCRNSAITNLVDPAKIGITYLSFIPDADLAKDCNNSAYFNKPPMSFVCLQKEFTYDFSATDPDGDSISYKMVDPLSGQDKNGVGVSDGNGQTEVNFGNKMGIPPIVPVKFKQGYDFKNPLGPGSYMKIDPLTGQLSFFPASEGLHVFAVVAEEWRKKKLINTNIRDFQVWVIKCEATPLPIELKPDLSKIESSVNGDTIYAEEDANFEFEIKIETPADSKIKFNYLPLGFLADTSVFKFKVRGTNPLFINIKGKVGCDLPDNLAKLTFIAEDANDCITKFSKELSLFLKVKPIKVEIPLISVDFLGNKMKDKKTIIAESGKEIRFKANITNLKKDDRPLSYEILTPNIKDPSGLIVTDVRENNEIKISGTWKIDCDYMKEPLQIIIKGIRTNRCNKATYIYDTIYVIVIPPVNPPAVLSLAGLDKFKKVGDYYYITRDQELCFTTTLKDVDPVSLLSWKIIAKNEDNSEYKGFQPEVTITKQENNLLEAKVCWAVSCDNFKKTMQIIINGYDSLFCSSPNVVSETLKVQFEGGILPPIRISYDYLSQVVSNDTIYFDANKEGCIDIILDDRSNQGDLKLTVSGEPVTGKVKNIATYNPSTGKTEMKSRFCWTPTCDEYNKSYVLDVQGYSKPPCDFEVTTPSKFIIKVVSPVNNLPIVEFIQNENTNKKLKPGTEYCFKATITDPDEITVLKAYEQGETFTANYGNGSQATVTFTGTNPIEANICFTPNCNIAGEEYPITICGKDEPCLPSEPVCVTLPLKIDECSIAFPNIFTPNNDGINDRFLPINIAGIEKYHIKIYDRWGNLVNESQTLEGWNGRTKIGDSDASEGQYFYTVEFKFFSGSKVMDGKRTSSFTLIR